MPRLACSRKSSMIAFVCVGAMLLSGCAEAPVEQKLTPVRGTMTYAGGSAAGVEIVFMPTSEPPVVVDGHPVYPSAKVQPDGTYTVETLGVGPGAMPGTYQLLLKWRAEVTDDQEASDLDKLLGWYDAAHSSITVKIKDGELQLPPIKLPAVSGPPEAVQGIPGRN